MCGAGESSHLVLAYARDNAQVWTLALYVVIRFSIFVYKLFSLFFISFYCKFSTPNLTYINGSGEHNALSRRGYKKG